MGGLSIWHWMIVLVVVLLLFGTGKVSNLMGEFGKGIKTFKQNVATDEDEKKDAKMAGAAPLDPQPGMMPHTATLDTPLPTAGQTTSQR